MTTKPDQQEQGHAPATATWWSTVKEIGIFVVGVASLAGFALFLMYLLQHLSASDSEWNRAIYLLEGVEAIAFAAAGYFFGKEVNRKRAENAEANAATQSVIAASKTSQLAVTEASVLALKAVIQGKRDMLLAPAAPSGRRAPEDDLRELVDLAERLFPSRP
jgi:hypothetical protein